MAKRIYRDSAAEKNPELENLAEQKLQEALEFNPNNTEALYYLGLVEITHRKNQKALEYFRKVLEKEPGKELRYKAYIQIGRIYYQEQSLVLAEDAIDKALNLLPAKGTAPYYKAMILAKSGDPAAAVPFARKAVELKYPKAEKLLVWLEKARRSKPGFTRLEVFVALGLLGLFLIPALFPPGRHIREGYNLKAIQALKYGQAYFDRRITRVARQDDFIFMPGREDTFYTLKITWQDHQQNHEIVLKGKDF